MWKCAFLEAQQGEWHLGKLTPWNHKIEHRVLVWQAWESICVTPSKDSNCSENLWTHKTGLQKIVRTPETHIFQTHIVLDIKSITKCCCWQLWGEEEKGRTFYGWGFFSDLCRLYYSISPFGTQACLTSVTIVYLWYPITGKIRCMSKMYFIVYRGTAFLKIKVIVSLTYTYSLVMKSLLERRLRPWS